MSQKPSDLLLSVIDFFGILIPGAVFAFLNGDFLLGPLGVSMHNTSQTLAYWIPAFFVSYVFGHFLLGFSGLLKRLVARLPSKETEAYFNAVRDRVKLPPGISQDRTNVFNSAFSYIRIHCPGAMAELERQDAECKLFRSLTFLFTLDIPLSALSGSFSLGRLLISLVGVSLAAYRFRWLFTWTHRLTYDLYLQLQESKRGEKQEPPAA